jgi:hypothetical protein
MAGRGPAPKDPAKRARTNSDPAPVRLVVTPPVKQPPLPTFTIPSPLTGKAIRFVWPAQTRTWWKMWGESPLSASFAETDWSFLLDTAILHARYWRGDMKAAAELRLRVAKFGATPEDRARLRIETTPPNREPAGQVTAAATGSRARRGGLKALSAAQ